MAVVTSDVDFVGRLLFFAKPEYGVLVVVNPLMDKARVEFRLHRCLRILRYRTEMRWRQVDHRQR